MIVKDEEEMRREIWSMERIFAQMSDLPQTYRTILGHHFNNRSLRNMLGYKLCRLVRDGSLYCADISRFRHSEVLFYTPDKKYTIVLEPDRFYGIAVWCYHENRRDRFEIHARGVYKLEIGGWAAKKDRRFHKGIIYKLI